MKFTLFTTAFLAAVASASSATDLLKEIPTCALKCIQEAEASAGCSSGDFKCSCQKLEQITPAATKCLVGQSGSNACNPKDLTGLPGAVQKICASIASGGQGNESIPSGPVSAVHTGNRTVPETTGASNRTVTLTGSPTRTGVVPTGGTSVPPTSGAAAIGASWAGAAVAMVAMAL